jgi:hypothetical protein
MIKKLLFTFLFFFGCFALQAQIVTGKIINSITLQPLANVAIVTNTNFGTTSDKLGEFKLQIKNTKNVTFSSLGYNSITLSIKKLKELNFIVSLSEKVNELEEIQLNLAYISLDSILVKTNRSMNKNYISKPSKYSFYSRENTKINFRTLDLDLEKSSLLSKENKRMAEKELTDYANSLKNTNPDFSSEFYGTISPKKVYSKKLKKYYNQDKIDSVKGYKLMKNSKNITIKEAQNSLQNIVLKHLNKDKTYRVSSGLFKVEDSLSLKETDSLLVDKSFGNNQPMYGFNKAKIKAFFFKFKDEINFFNQKYYNHTLEKNEILKNELLYVVGFNPRKSKAKFSGKIFINPKDFRVTKIDYEYANGKKGMSFNLKWILGVKASSDLNKVTLMYGKNKDDKVYASYYKEIKGSYAYVHRPIKFKENSSTRNKVKFDFKIELDTKEIQEVLITNVLTIDKHEIKSEKKADLNKKTPYITLEEYQNSIWKNRTLIKAYLDMWK